MPLFISMNCGRIVLEQFTLIKFMKYLLTIASCVLALSVGCISAAIYINEAHMEEAYNQTHGRLKSSNRLSDVAVHYVVKSGVGGCANSRCMLACALTCH